MKLLILLYKKNKMFLFTSKYAFFANIIYRLYYILIIDSRFN